MSKGIHKVLSNSNMVIVQGQSWQAPGAKNEVSLANLGANILCKRHNERLSGLDAVGIRLMRSLRYDPSVTRGTGNQWFLGEEVELWMLKVACGVVAARTKGKNKGLFEFATIPPKWLSILFREEPFPRGWGLYCPGSSRGMPSAEDQAGQGHIAIRSIIAPYGNLVGLELGMIGFPFLLSLADPPLRHSVPGFRDHTFRPGNIVIERDAGQTTIAFVWEREGERSSIRVSQGITIKAPGTKPPGQV